MSFALILIAALVATQTDNVLAGIATIPALTYGFQAVTGLSLVSSDGMMAFGALAAINRGGNGVPNPGGGRRLFLVPIDQLTGEWPKRSDIVGGEITTVPPLTVASAGPPAVLAGAFVEVAVSDNSLKLDESMKGAVGYQSWEQGIEVKIAGFTKDQVVGIEKLLNQEVVCMALLNDGQRVIIGTSLNGQQFEIMHSTGAKGGDRREWTLKSKQDGYMFGYQPLAATVVIPGIPA